MSTARVWHNTADARLVRRSIYNLREYTVDTYNKLWVPSNAFVGGSASAVFGSRWKGLSLPNSATTTLYASQRMPVYWRSGTMVAILHIANVDSKTTASRAVTIKVDLGGFTSDETTAASTTSTDNYSSLPSQNHMKTYDTSANLSHTLSGDEEWMGITVERQGSAGGDSYEGDVALLGVELRFQPGRR